MSLTLTSWCSHIAWIPPYESSHNNICFCLSVKIASICHLLFGSVRFSLAFRVRLRLFAKVAFAYKRLSHFPFLFLWLQSYRQDVFVLSVQPIPFPFSLQSNVGMSWDFTSSFCSSNISLSNAVRNLGYFTLSFNNWSLVFSRVHATLHPALSVRPSVGPSHFYLFYQFYLLKWFKVF